MVLCLGRKGRDLLKKHYADLIVKTVDGLAKKGAKYYEAADIAEIVMDMFVQKQINVCEVVYSKFKSAISRDICTEQILPVKIENFEYNKVHAPTNVVRGSVLRLSARKGRVARRFAAAGFSGELVSGDRAEPGF